jgi:hypothetical protein
MFKMAPGLYQKIANDGRVFALRHYSQDQVVADIDGVRSGIETIIGGTSTSAVFRALFPKDAPKAFKMVGGRVQSRGLSDSKVKLKVEKFLAEERRLHTIAAFSPQGCIAAFADVIQDIHLSDKAELIYAVRSDFRNLGLGSEVAHAALQVCIADPYISEVYARVLCSNNGSNLIMTALCREMNGKVTSDGEMSRMYSLPVDYGRSNEVVQPPLLERAVGE